MDPEINPYLAPESAVARPVDVLELDDAGLGRRFGTFLIDYICSLEAGAVLGVVIRSTSNPQALAVLDGPIGYFFGIGVMIAYYVAFEGIWARTPGKWICRTVVVDEVGGGPPSVGQVLKRTLSRFIPFEPFSFLGGDRGWHDLLSKTRVVVRRRG